MTDGPTLWPKSTGRQRLHCSEMEMKRKWKYQNTNRPNLL